MTVKIIGAAMIFLSCLLFGFGFADRLKKRCVYLRNLQTALNLLETEISFGGRKMKRAFQSVEKAADCRGLFLEAAKNMEDLGIKKAWNDAVASHQNELCLTNEDADVLQTLGAQLGMTDAENQVKNIRYVKEMLQMRLNDAEGEYEKTGRLCRSGGALMGVFLILLLF